MKTCFVIASVDVERHARDFMEAAKKLQLYFIGLQREDQPTIVETLRKVCTFFQFKEGLSFMINVAILFM